MLLWLLWRIQFLLQDSYKNFKNLGSASAISWEGGDDVKMNYIRLIEVLHRARTVVGKMETGSGDSLP